MSGSEGKPPGAQSTIVGLIPPEKQPAPAQPAAPAPPAQPPPTKRSALPPPVRGPQQAGQRPPSGSVGALPSSAAPQPVGQPGSAPHVAPAAGVPPSAAPAAPPSAPHGAAPAAQSYGAQPSPYAAPAAQPFGAQPSAPQAGVPLFGGQAASAASPYDAPMGGPVSPGAVYDAANPPHDLPMARASYGHSPHTDLPPGASFDQIEAPGSKFVAFLKISSKRAFRLRIEPAEVLPSERRALESASPPITDRNLQAFLAWRRSVLFLVACALIPLTIIGAIDALQSRHFKPIFFVRAAPAIAEGVFAWICWNQLKQWASWRSQRRKLFFGWLLFMLTPFIVFVYPLRTIFEELGGSSREKLLALGVEGVYRQAVMPFVFAMLAMLQLAPKAISLMPGLIRASLVIKLLFPGSSAPGWLMVMAAPLYALLAYVILIIPYQFTGSGWFIAGVLGVIVAQANLARAGFALAKPLEESEALKHIKKIRRYYVGTMLLSAILIIVALGSLVAQLNLRATDVVTAVMKFESNVLILTMIGADLVVTNLDRARNYTAGRNHVEEQTEVKIAAFVSLETPPPPPPGPAQ